MEKIGEMTTTACIFCILFTGCYSSSMIQLNDDWKGRIPSDKIECVVTKDGTKYQLRTRPTLVKDAIVMRPTGGENDRILSNDIDYIVTKNGAKYVFDEPPAIFNNTILMKPSVNVKEKLFSSGRITSVLAKDNVKHHIDAPPALSDSGIVFKPSVSIPLSDVDQLSSGDKKGKVNMNRIRSVVTKDGTKYEFAEPPDVSHDIISGVAVNKSVSIPLSDVACVSVEEFDRGKTIWAVVGVVTITGMIVAASALDGFFDFSGVGR